MSNITALLHRAAISGLTIYFDDVAECAKMWPTKRVDPALLKELDAHSNENRAFSSRRSIFRLLLPGLSDDSALMPQIVSPGVSLRRMATFLTH